MSSYLLDTAGLLVTVAYNIRSYFPFSTYGENVALVIQNLIITSLILLYSPVKRALSSQQQGSTAAIGSIVTFLAVAGASMYALLNEHITPMPLLRSLLTAAIPVSLLAKVPQIWSIYQNKSSGQLSAFLVFNSLMGCLARVFTTQTETGDSILWWGYVLAAALNGVLALQLAYYWNSTNVDVVKEKEKNMLENRPVDNKRSGMAALGSGHSVNVSQSGAVPATGGPRPGSPMLKGSGARPASKQWVRKAD